MIVTGYYNIVDNSITLFCDKEQITAKDMENDDRLKAVGLHECVHAILKRNKLECLLNGIQYGTGIVEKYKMGIELGRGINEGYTNWVCKKAGYDVGSYLHLMNIVDILELGVGEENVMKLGKGNIRDNVSKQLTMDDIECVSLLSKTDNIYYIGYKKLPRINQIIDLLDKYKNKNELSPKDRKLIEKEYSQYINGEETYWKNIKILQKEFDESDIKDGDVETQIEYFKTIQTSMEESIRDSIGEINKNIFSKYFSKEFENMTHMDYENVDKIDLEYLSKFDNLYKLMGIANYIGVEDFEKDYKNLDKAIYVGSCLKLDDKVMSGTLTIGQLNKLGQLVSRDTSLWKHEFFHNAAEMICPNYTQIAENLITKLFEYDRLDELSEYSVVKIKSENIEEIAYQKNGEIVEIEKSDAKTDRDQDILDLDFTIDETEDEQTIINNFLELKQKVMEENPKAKIKIQERLITIENENDKNYYLITNSEILPAKIERIEDFKLNILPDKQNEKTDLPAIIKRGIFSKIVDAFKNRFSRDVMIEPVFYDIEPEASKQVVFRDSIRDFSLYDTTTNIVESNSRENSNRDNQQDRDEY